jgi:predicted nucleotidyltransferase
VRAESVVFEIAKFVSLCAAANPNALEILFADERDWLFETPAWRLLHAERQQFLTRKVQQTYLGYALAQLKRIRTHRSWLLTPPQKKPTRSDFGLPDASTLVSDDQNRLEQSIADKLRSYRIDNVDMSKAARIAVEERLRRFWRDTSECSEAELESRMRAVASHALKIPAQVVSTLNSEKKYLAAMKHWESYQTWKAERNANRAELEQKHGYDTKHAMHLVRLMRMGLEVLETGELRVRREDAEELNAIRDGGMSYEELMDEAGELQRRMQGAAPHSALPVDVELERVDKLLFALVRV